MCFRFQLLAKNVLNSIRSAKTISWKRGSVDHSKEKGPHGTTLDTLDFLLTYSVPLTELFKPEPKVSNATAKTVNSHRWVTNSFTFVPQRKSYSKTRVTENPLAPAGHSYPAGRISVNTSEWKGHFRISIDRTKSSSSRLGFCVVFG